MSSSSNLWVLLGLGLAGVFLMAQKLKRVVKKELGAFVEHLELLPPPPPPPPKAPHPLTGLTFAVADSFDVNEFITGFGSIDWARTHEPATQTSPVVSALVDGGATCIGKTVIDEMAYSINGENKHFGTPTNPAAPERIPGGCSSGSAAAVAGGLVDFSLGVDTIGGVRIPGAFCGILGFRSSHAAVSYTGVIPVSPSLDTVGLFAKDPSILRRVGQVLLQLPYSDARQPRHIMIADDCFELSKIPASRLTQVVIKSVEELFGRQVLSHVNLGSFLSSKVPSMKHLQNGNKNSDFKQTSLVSLAVAMRSLLKHEFKNNHLDWINSVHPAVDSNIMNDLSEDSNADVDYYQSVRDQARLAVNSLLKDDGLLVLPTVLGSPPKLSAREISSEGYKTHILCLTAIASMSGCCQVTVPLGVFDKCPLSVSFIARHGGDCFLLDSIQTMYPTLQKQVDLVLKSNVSSNDVSKEVAAEIAKEKGNIAYKDKQWQKAAGLYTEAIKLNGKMATYYSNRAAAYLELGSYQQAETDCTTAISLDKKNVKAYLRRGTAREMLGYCKDAIEDFNYALVLEPTNKTANVAAKRLKKLFQ
ncbi:translocon at the outer membrane of chloroplasts 64 [Typha latifolia]|uniref:translocon at the outer membrane of chloroplasts 64 n=1 Tax=Typha latifolia TaxID=4733 RepID=UPI003C2DF242